MFNNETNLLNIAFENAVNDMPLSNVDWNTRRASANTELSDNFSLSAAQASGMIYSAMTTPTLAATDFHTSATSPLEEDLAGLIDSPLQDPFRGGNLERNLTRMRKTGTVNPQAIERGFESEAASTLWPDKTALLASMTRGMIARSPSPITPPPSSSKRTVSSGNDGPATSKRRRSTRPQSVKKVTPAKKGGGQAGGTSTNKAAKPTEHSSIYVNAGSAVLDGPFNAYPRPLPPPVKPVDEALRDNPYLKNIIGKSNVATVSTPVVASTATTTPDPPAIAVAATVSPTPSTMTNPAYAANFLPTLEELEALKEFIQYKFQSIVDKKTEEGIILMGRERDKLFNRVARVPKLFIETRLKGIEGFKQECIAWDTAMNHRQILQRRDFFRDKLVEVEKMMEKVKAREAQGV